MLLIYDVYIIAYDPNETRVMTFLGTPILFNSIQPQWQPLYFRVYRQMTIHGLQQRKTLHLSRLPQLTIPIMSPDDHLRRHVSIIKYITNPTFGQYARNTLIVISGEFICN